MALISRSIFSVEARMKPMASGISSRTAVTISGSTTRVFSASYIALSTILPACSSSEV